MNAMSKSSKVAVIGAGTMGAGIAQVAALAGHDVVLIDIAEGVAQQGKDNIQAGLGGFIKRGKLTQDQADTLLSKITPANNLESAADATLVIEAIIENLTIKQQLYAQVEALTADDTIIASNTSSISISALSSKSARPENIIGMHFFNPATILKLVEVVSGLHTSADVADSIFATALAWGKKPVHTKSTPGFIVNRVARPFYAEALRSLNEQVASVATIDALMRSCGGFKMGPLELTDLIGQDVNSAVTESVYHAFFQDKRFIPSILQTEMVSAGSLGRKSGKGFYDYTADKVEADTEAKITSDKANLKIKVVGEIGPVEGLFGLIQNAEYELEQSGEGLPRIEVGDAIIQLSDGRTATQRAAEQCTPNLILFDYAADYQTSEMVALSMAQQASAAAREDAIDFFQILGRKVSVIKDVPGMLVLRTICMLINEAYDAVNQGVCDSDAVDVAMQAGVAYPKGPFAWGQDIGLAYVVRVLINIQQAYGEERYRVSPLLKDKQYV